MQFAQPLWLLVGLITCAFVLWSYRRFDKRQRIALGQFAATRLLPRLAPSVSWGRRHARRALFLTGLLLTFVALARPQAGYVWEETHRKGLELLFAVDTSKSMLSQDVKPDRLMRAKLAVHDLVEKLNGDGVGLIAFAGNAFVQSPITLDYDAFLESLDALDTNTIPRGGTDIAAAIHEAEATFKTRTAAEKILVLVTDGEDLEASGIAAAKEAAQQGVKIFTVGVGTVAGELIPVTTENGGTDFVKDENGKPVRSRLDETTLRKIAEETGGMYEPLGVHGEGLNAIYDKGLAQFTRHDLSTRRTKVYIERFYWALLGAVACFMAGMLIGTRRHGTEPKRASEAASTAMPVKIRRRGRVRPVAATAGALALVLAMPVASHASPQSAEKEYRAGDFAKAQQDYAATAAKERKPELQFNAGSAAYKAGDYAQATTDFQGTLKTGDVPVQQNAYYNLGNTQFREGQKTEQTKPQETIKTWEEAVKSYNAALQIKAEDADAKYNRDLVQRRLDALKKQEQQKQQQQQNRQNQKDQKDQPKNQSQSGNKDQNQPQSGNQNQDAKDSKGSSKDQQNKPQQGSQDGDQKNQSPSAQAQPKDSTKDEKSQQGKGQQTKDQHAKAGQPKPDQTAQSQKGNGSSTAQQQPQPREGNQDQASAGQQRPKPEQGPDKKVLTGKAEAAHGEEPKNGDSASPAANERREPGQMTRQEAEQLLDALKGDEKKLPAYSQLRGGGQPRNDQPLKDW
jgi:Ca-activated chloride channel family protein